MNSQWKPTEILFLWQLAVSGGGDWFKDVKPQIDARVRKRLEAAKLIDVEKRKSPSGRGSPMFVSLSDAGWRWLEENLDVDLTSKSPAGTSILQKLLCRLKTFTERANVSLSDLLSPAEKSAEDGEAYLDELVKTTYLTISRGETNVRVRLAEIRKALCRTPRERLDETLLRMAGDGRASLYRLDNPAEIHAEDREAVLRTATGEERHILYLGGRGS